VGVEKKKRRTCVSDGVPLWQGADGGKDKRGGGRLTEKGEALITGVFAKKGSEQLEGDTARGGHLGQGTKKGTRSGGLIQEKRERKKLV